MLSCECNIEFKRAEVGSERDTQAEVKDCSE